MHLQAGRYTRAFYGPVIVQPAWFTESLKHPPEDGYFHQDGARIHYRHWVNSGKPGLVLVHGHAAHAHWWDFIAPAFKDNYNIVAIDLSGSGDSDHRQKYSAQLFASEIVGCIKAIGLDQATVAGHSFGGSMTRIAAHLFPQTIEKCILVDSNISTVRGSRTPPPMPNGRVRYYKNADEGMRRFRLRPAQPSTNDYITNYIASHSLRQSEHGYHFKLDPAVLAKMPADNSLPVASEMIRNLPMPVAMIYGRNSRFFPPGVVETVSDIIPAGHIIGIDDAYHHVFLDQPIRFIEALKRLLTII